MSSFLNSTTLVDSVKRRSHTPESQVTFQTDDFLAFANEEVSMGIVPSVLQFHEEFFVATSESPLVAGQSSYTIPARAIGGKIRTLFYKDGQGQLREMSRISPENLPYYQQSATGDAPYSFYLENDKVVLVPAVGQTVSGSLVFKYFQRPNQLVAANQVATIRSINTTSGDVIVDAIPSAFSASQKMDLQQRDGSHRNLAIDLSPVSVNGTLKTISFDPAALPSDLSVGDYVCLAGESFIPQIPDELHVVLAQRVACRCLEAQGDQAGLQAANQKLLEMEQRMGNVIDNRTEAQPLKVNNLRGTLRSVKAPRGGRRI